MKTLQLFPSLSTRTVIRHTLVKDWNVGWEDEYARLDALANPMFIEPKGYVFVGDSRRRMSMDNMPSHEMITEFSKRLGDRLGMEILKERKDSRVLVLGKNNAQLRIPGL
jgi:tRNA wybutosine-synthesizing protein 1